MTSANTNPISFDNRFVAELPGDRESANTRRQVHGACYSRVQPTAVTQPQVLAYAAEVAALLDLPAGFCESQLFADVFGGNALLPGMDPYAMCYGGHQFGNWAGQLGDGRAINLGETVNGRGERWAMQLKGAGPTPYSRTADGLAVLRSSVREFLCSEAMYHLGVPTTRALSLVLTGEQIVRDMFYDGNPQREPGAVVCRVSPSFTRFGSFEIFAARGDTDLLKQLVDYTIRTDFPHLAEPCRDVYLEWFREVCTRTREMIVHWMRVGYVHGVMNTDNMSILGLTIDYGPYGWLEDYDPDWTPNTTDAQGRRYRFGNQPAIANWNLTGLANAIYPLIEDVAPLQEIMDEYGAQYQSAWQEMMAAKLGLKAFDAKTDEALIAELLEILQLVETDMTIFFRNLAAFAPDDIEAVITPLSAAWYVPEQITDEYRERLSTWLGQYGARLQREDSADASRRGRMNAVNPKYVLRNYLAQLAIDKADEGDGSLVYELLACLRHPYDEQPGMAKFAERRPEWARSRPGCSMLSCSS
jgi:uncharacterized protein YdiU (UPF0061 family)